MKKDKESHQDLEVDTERFSKILKKAVTSPPVPLKPVRAKRRTSR